MWKLSGNPAATRLSVPPSSSCFCQETFGYRLRIQFQLVSVAVPYNLDAKQNTRTTKEKCESGTKLRPVVSLDIRGSASLGFTRLEFTSFGSWRQFHVPGNSHLEISRRVKDIGCTTNSEVLQKQDEVREDTLARVRNHGPWTLDHVDCPSGWEQHGTNRSQRDNVGKDKHFFTLDF